MSHVDVVPVRGVPAERMSFTYHLPDDLKVEPGSLVVVPFRRRPVLGVIWATSVKAPTDYRTEDISQVPLTRPFLTEWQRRLAAAMASTGATSLGTVLVQMVPKLSLRRLVKLFETAPPSSPATTSHEQTPERYWYRDRVAAINWVVGWMERSSSGRVVIVPTVEDGEELRRMAADRALDVPMVDARMSPTAYAELYRRVASGATTTVIGTLRALELPWPVPPQVLVDQEEHHAHKQSAQHPRYDVRVILEAIGRPYSITSPAPSIRWVAVHGLPPVPEPTTTRRTISLDQPGSFSWLSEDAATIIRQALDGGRQAVCITPRSGYASATVCRSCDQVQACPQCGRRVSIVRGTGHAGRCRFCRADVPLQAVCPRCGGTSWGFRSLGSEAIVELCQRRWPERSVTPVVRADVPFDIGVDSYRAYHQLHRLQALGAVVVISGEALLNIPDFSTNERAWQFLARLGAERPKISTVVQTFQPEHDFWQRWQSGDDAAWYRHELEQRRRLGLPPAVRQWVARLPGRAAAGLSIAIDRFVSAHTGQVEVTELPTAPTPSTTRRWLLTWADGYDPDRVVWSSFFPTPWQLDRSPQSWLD